MKAEIIVLYDTKCDTLGQLAAEKPVIFKHTPLIDFSAIFHSFLMFSLKFMTIPSRFFSYLPINILCLGITLISSLVLLGN